MLIGASWQVQRQVVWSEEFVRFLQTPTAALVIWSAVLAALVAVGFYVICKFRPTQENDTYSISDWISHFRELHSSGVLRDEEFRTIKTKLGQQLQQQMLQSQPDQPSAPSGSSAPEGSLHNRES